MNTKLHPLFDIRYACFASFGAALLAAFTLLATAPAAVSQTVWGNALSFDGVDDYVEVPHADALNAFPLTVSAWIKTSNREAARNAAIVNKYQSASANGWNLYVREGRIRAWYFKDAENYVWDNAQGLDGGDVADGLWHHVAFAVGTDGGRLYVDGTVRASTNWTGSAGPPSTDTALSLGLYPGPGDLVRYYQGLIDDVRIWNAERSAEEIRQDLNHPLSGTEANLVAYWKLDEGGGVAAHDGTSNGYDGSLVNGPQWTASGIPPWGTALSFDGVDDYAVSEQNIDLANKSFTIEAWAQRRSADGRMQMILAQGAGGRLMFGYHWGNLFGLYFYDPGVTIVETDTAWHHWAGTYDAATGARCLYRDGILVASDTAPTAYTGSGQVYIGREPFGDPAYFDGAIDELRIWNVARSAEEINACMCIPLTGRESNLVVYWNLDERAGATAFDRTTHGYDATLQSGPVWTPSMVTCSKKLADRVLTIYFAGTGATSAWVTNSYWQDTGFGELLATLYTFDDSDEDLGSTSSTHYKHFVNGIGTGTGAVADFVTSLCVSDLPLYQERGWRVCLEQGENALRTVLETHPGEDVILNLVGWSRGGVLAMWMARSATAMADADRVSSINVLAFDPVPGICINTMQALLGQLVLTEPEMRGQNIVQLSSKVKQFVGVYAQDERSYKFEPVIPSFESSNTKRWLFRLRGSHETIVGNPQVNGHSFSVGFPDLGVDTDGLRPVGAISGAISQELLTSWEWGVVPFAPEHLWSTGHADPRALLQEYIDKMNENSSAKYSGMRRTSTTVMFSTYDLGHWVLWRELLCTWSLFWPLHWPYPQPEPSRLCYVAPYYTEKNLVNHERVFWLDEQMQLINRETAWDTLSLFARKAWMIQVTAPNGGEAWVRGQDHLIQWNDNIAEDVVIELFKGGTLLSTIATAPSTGVYEWEVDAGLDPGCDYSIRIRSSVSGTMSDVSGMTFTICDTPMVDPNSVACFPDGRVQFDLSVPGAAQATVLGSTNLLDWEEVRTVPLTEGSATFVDENETHLPCRFYRLRVP